MAYVAAWLYVEETEGVSDAALRDEARETYGREGDVEVDDDAEVSR